MLRSRCAPAGPVLLTSMLVSLSMFAGPLAAPARSGPSLPDAVSAELEALAATALSSLPMPGMVVGVVSGGELVYSRGFGVADRGTGTPVDPDTLFQIGSISKSFTATVAARLVDRGLLDLDDAVVDHLPTARLDPRITLRHLASHTAGLPGDPPTLRRKHGDYPVLAFTHFELYRSMAEAQLQSPPGSAWAYSNFGYGILGHVLEMVTDTPFEVLVAEEVFAPLGMDASTVTIWPELAGRLATPYWLVDGRLEEYPSPWDEEALAPAGGIASSLRDLGRFAAFQLAVARAGEGTLAALQQPGREVRPGLHYGLGWFVEDLAGLGNVVSVGGDVDGYVGEIVLVPGHDVATVVLANTGDAPLLPSLGRWLLAALRAPADPEAEREARYRLGLAYQSLGSWERAVELFSGLVSEERGHPAALYQLGRTGALSGLHLHEAVAALRRYLAGEPVPGMSRASARWRLGAVLEHAGECEEARDEYLRALDEEPGHSPVAAALERLDCRAEPGGEQARTEIGERARAFSEAYVAADIGALTDFYTDDAELLPPGGAVVRGREAIRVFWSGLEPGRTLQHGLETTFLRVVGRVATESGRWTERALDDESREHLGSGRYLVVWERGRDGVWRMSRDMWHPSDLGE